MFIYNFSINIIVECAREAERENDGKSCSCTQLHDKHIFYIYFTSSNQSTSFLRVFFLSFAFALEYGNVSQLHRAKTHNKSIISMSTDDHNLCVCVVCSKATLFVYKLHIFISFTLQRHTRHHGVTESSEMNISILLVHFSSFRSRFVASRCWRVFNSSLR